MSSLRAVAATAVIAACALGLAATSASAALPWIGPLDLSQFGRDASNPRVASDAAGNTVAIWERLSTLGPSKLIQVSTRERGGAFGAPLDLSLRSSDPDIAMTPGGTAIAVWSHLEENPGVYVIQASIRPPGGAFSPPHTVWVAPPGAVPGEIRVAVNAAGASVVTWSSSDPDSGFDQIECENAIGLKVLCPNPLFVQAAVGTPDGSFSAAERVSPERGVGPPGESESERLERLRRESLQFASEGRGAIDAAGDVIVDWTYLRSEFEGVIQAAFRPAGLGQAFTEPETVSTPGGNAEGAGIGMDAAGNAVAAWFQSQFPDHLLRVATRPAGAASFGAPVQVSEDGADADDSLLEVNEAGTAAVAWRSAAKGETFIKAAVSPPGGSFSAPYDVSAGTNTPIFPDLALGANGTVALAWSAESGAKKAPRGAVLLPGAVAFTPPSNLTPSGNENYRPHVAVDGSGDTTAVWTRSNGFNMVTQANVFDGGPPQLSGVSIPLKGVVGDPVPIAAAVSDFWPIAAPTFSFGDGAAAVGSAVSHVYTARGTYPVTVVSTNAGGVTTTRTESISIRTRGDFRVGKLKKRRRKGTGLLPVTVDGPGTLTLAGTGVRGARAHCSKAGTVLLSVRARGKSLRVLDRTGEAKIAARVSFTPEGGPANARQVEVTLAKRVR